MTTASDDALRRDFITIDGAFGPRQVHYRRGGRGPVVLLLHQSPQSSREMEPLIAAWGGSFTLIAPDSPGYGCSTPLLREGRPVATATMDDFATATLEFADALGLGRFGIYGFHTGASIGTALAAAHPARISALAANGLVVLTPAERAVILRDYLPPLVPRWDGGHLAWLWGRMREQTIFFPWHDRRAATRMDFDVPPADRLQAGLLEFLAAGAHYPVAYRAAFEDRAELRLPAFRVPLLVTAAARDPLGGHLARLGGRSASVQVEASADAATALARCHEHLARHPGDPPPARIAMAPASGLAGPASRYGGVPGGQVRVLHRPATRPALLQPALVLLHAPGGSASTADGIAATLAAHGEVFTPDLPGHGASDPVTTAGQGGALEGTLDRLAAALKPALPAGRPVVIVALGASALVGTLLAKRFGPGTGLVRVDGLAGDPASWLRDGLPPLAPVWYGGHLLEAWHLVRDGRVFTPWFRRDRGGIRAGEPDLDDGRIQQEVGDLLRANGAWQALLRDVLEHAPAPAVALSGPVVDLPGVPSDWSAPLAQAGAPAS